MLCILKLHGAGLLISTTRKDKLSFNLSADVKRNKMINCESKNKALRNKILEISWRKMLTSLYYLFIICLSSVYNINLFIIYLWFIVSPDISTHKHMCALIYKYAYTYRIHFHSQDKLNETLFKIEELCINLHNILLCCGICSTLCLLAIYNLPLVFLNSSCIRNTKWYHCILMTDKVTV